MAVRAWAQVSHTQADQATSSEAELECHLKACPILWHVCQPGLIDQSFHKFSKQQYELQTRRSNMSLCETLQSCAIIPANRNSKVQTFSGIRDVWAKESIKDVFRDGDVL